MLARPNSVLLQVLTSHCPKYPRDRFGRVRRCIGGSLEGKLSMFSGHMSFAATVVVPRCTGTSRDVGKRARNS